MTVRYQYSSIISDPGVDCFVLPFHVTFTAQVVVSTRFLLEWWSYHRERSFRYVLPEHLHKLLAHCDIDVCIKLTCVLQLIRRTFMMQYIKVYKGLYKANIYDVIHTGL